MMHVLKENQTSNNRTAPSASMSLRLASDMCQLNNVLKKVTEAKKKSWRGPTTFCYKERFFGELCIVM